MTDTTEDEDNAVFKNGHRADQCAAGVETTRYGDAERRWLHGNCQPEDATTIVAEPKSPEPWSVWANPYNGYLVWHEPTRKWLPVINDMAEAVDPSHPAAQNLHQLSTYHGIECTQRETAIQAGMTQTQVFRTFEARLDYIAEALDAIRDRDDWKPGDIR